jgi:hypothetical protein
MNFTEEPCSYCGKPGGPGLCPACESDLEQYAQEWTDSDTAAEFSAGIQRGCR